MRRSLAAAFAVLVFLVALPAASNAAGTSVTVPPADCSAPQMNTVERAECAQRAANVALETMLRRYADLRREIGRLPLRRSVVADLDEGLAATQKAWMAFARRECALEADLTLGSAGAYVGAFCLRRLFEKRALRLAEGTE